jgi:hypothetical protein
MSQTNKKTENNIPIVLLNNDMLNKINMGNINFINSFDITADNKIQLASTNQFYLLEWQKIIPIEPKLSSNISTFAYTSTDFLVMVAQNSLCVMDSLGRLIEYCKLPNQNMGIGVGENVMYAYDKTKQRNGYAIYLLYENALPMKIVEVQTSITSVVETMESVIFSTNDEIFSIDIETNKIERLVLLSKEKGRINSITMNFFTNVLFFSTDNAVYAVKDKDVGCVIKKIGGIVKCYYEELFIFNPQNKFLLMYNVGKTLK